MSGFDSVANVLAVAFSDVSNYFTIAVSDWSSVRSVRSLLCATIVHLVRMINADKHTAVLAIVVVHGKSERVKSFPSHKAHRAALISVSLALSLTPAYTARPCIWG